MDTKICYQQYIIWFGELENLNSPCRFFFYIFLTVFIVSGCTGYFDTNKQDSLVDVLDSTKQEFTLKYGEMDTFILKQREDGS